jgi:hypothetical protein
MLFHKKKKEGLEQALALGLITLEEKLRIEASRSSEKLENFLKRMEKKTSKK